MKIGKRSLETVILVVVLFTLCIAFGMGIPFEHDPVDKNPNAGTDASTADSSPLYRETREILVQANLIVRDHPDDPNDIPYRENRSFNPQTPRVAELYPEPYTSLAVPCNSFESYCNAANRLVDVELAACVVVAGQPGVGNHEGYAHPEVWAEEWIPIPGEDKYKYQFPDTIPATADAGGTNGTQFIQLIVPYEIDYRSVFDPVNEHNRILRSAVRIQNRVSRTVKHGIYGFNADDRGFLRHASCFQNEPLGIQVEDLAIRRT